MDTCNYNNVLMRDRIQQKNHVRRLNEMVCYRKKASNDSKFFTECDPVDLYVEKVTLQNLIWTFICRSRNLGTRLRFETTAETQSNEGFLLTFSLKIPFIESVKLNRQKKYHRPQTNYRIHFCSSWKGSLDLNQERLHWWLNLYSLLSATSVRKTIVFLQIWVRSLGF